MSNPTIGFIGYGNMAQAIAEGLVAAGAIDGTDIVACAAHYDKLEKTTAKVGATPLRTAAEVADAADVVIIAIKPYQIESVIKPIAGALANESTFVVSIAAGWDLARYRELFGADFGAMHIQCTIPEHADGPSAKGVLVTETDNTLTDAQNETFEKLFSSISLIERVDSAHMASACASPAARRIHRHVHRALGDAGVKYGLQRATAYRLAAKMVEGVGALYLANETHPGAMKDAVCSPGGTTIKGVASLEESAFRGAVIKAVDAIEA